MTKTRIEVDYPVSRGLVSLRGADPDLGLEVEAAPSRVSGQRQLFELDLPNGSLVEFKLRRDDGEWAAGRNVWVSSGESIRVEPVFERSFATLEPRESLRFDPLDRDLEFQLLLPPSYGERADKRYPVLYVQDGQAAFEPDPFDGRSLGLDSTLGELWELGAVREMIVVAIRTDRDRDELLTPTFDDRIPGGGNAAAYRDWIASTLIPHVAARYRALDGPEATSLLGSSMGGLFSFFAAWTRPDAFGRAAALSGSFWWDDRWMIREVRRRRAPQPLPWIYLDSGAAASPFEENPSRSDGLHHVSALHAALACKGMTAGRDLHMLAFAGMEHGNAAWSERLAIPLQLMFPPAAGGPNVASRRSSRSE